MINFLPAVPSTTPLPTHLARLPNAEAERRKVNGFTHRTFIAVGHSYGGCTSYALPPVFQIKYSPNLHTQNPRSTNVSQPLLLPRPHRPRHRQTTQHQTRIRRRYPSADRQPHPRRTHEAGYMVIKACTYPPLPSPINSPLFLPFYATEQKPFQHSKKAPSS